MLLFPRPRSDDSQVNFSGVSVVGPSSDASCIGQNAVIEASVALTRTFTPTPSGGASSTAAVRFALFTPKLQGARENETDASPLLDEQNTASGSAAGSASATAPAATSARAAGGAIAQFGSSSQSSPTGPPILFVRHSAKADSVAPCFTRS